MDIGRWAACEAWAMAGKTQGESESMSRLGLGRWPMSF